MALTQEWMSIRYYIANLLVTSNGLKGKARLSRATLLPGRPRGPRAWLFSYFRQVTVDALHAEVLTAESFMRHDLPTPASP